MGVVLIVVVVILLFIVFSKVSSKNSKELIYPLVVQSLNTEKPIEISDKHYSAAERFSIDNGGNAKNNNICWATLQIFGKEVFVNFVKVPSNGTFVITASYMTITMEQGINELITKITEIASK